MNNDAEMRDREQSQWEIMLSRAKPVQMGQAHLCNRENSEWPISHCFLKSLWIKSYWMEFQSSHTWAVQLSLVGL